jgi:hypothetical protein
MPLLLIFAVKCDDCGDYFSSDGTSQELIEKILACGWMVGREGRYYCRRCWHRHADERKQCPSAS